MAPTDKPVNKFKEKKDMRKLVWVVLTLLMVAALVLSSCQAATVEEEKEGTTVTGQVTEKETQKVEEKKEEAVVEEEKGPEMVKNIWGNLVEKPQYGGTIRYRVLPHQVEHFDPLWWDANNSNAIINDRMATAPWEKGPEGSGEYGLDYSSYTVDVYRGELLVGWEQTDLYTCNFELKPGIHFWDKPPVNGRELTIDDTIWSWIRNSVNLQSNWYWSESEAASFWETELSKVDNGEFPRSKATDWLATQKDYWKGQLEAFGYDITDENVTKRYPSVIQVWEDHGYDVTDTPLGSAYLEKTGKYSLTFHKWAGDVEIWNDMTSLWNIPREVVETYGDVGMDSWDTVVSMGPWIPVDYVRDSSATFEKNPNYWGVDPNLPDNQLPYADKLLVLNILDQATYLAALRTAKIDIGGVVWHKVETFKENCPEMKFKANKPTQSHTISVRNDIPPFSDIRVRKAAMLAIDQLSMLNDFYEGNAFLYTWPIQDVFTSVYTPFEEWPRDIQELYEYHPDKAKELLTEAGYPNGFKTKFYVYPSADDRESCLVVAAYLKDVGIDAEVVLPETASFIEILYGREYEHMISCWWGNNFTMDALLWAEGGNIYSPYNFGNVVDDKLVEFADAYAINEDLVQRDKDLKEINMYELGQVYNLIIPIPVGHTFWWPWLKNYSGETDLGWPDETGWGEIPKYIWVDQDLKYELTGRRD